MGYTKLLTKNNIRIFVSDVTDVAQETINHHKPTPLAGLTLATATTVFGPFGVIKGRGKSSALIKSSGIIKSILVEMDAEGNIRSLVGNPNLPTDFDKKDINQIPIKLAIGETGILRVVNQFAGENFGGEVELAKGDIVTDFAYYFHQSEQIFTAVLSDVRLKDENTVDRAFGVIFQMLPGHDEEDIIWVENFIKNNKLSTMTLEKYISLLDAHELTEFKLKWKCNCSQEKMKEVVALLTPEEIHSILEKEGKIEVMCNFCNTKYVIDMTN